LKTFENYIYFEKIYINFDIIIFFENFWDSKKYSSKVVPKIGRCDSCYHVCTKLGYLGLA
jgi:hypothetical protein